MNSMPTAELFSIAGEKRTPVELMPSIFAIEPSEHAIYQVVKAYRNNQRQGTASTKNRSQVRGRGRKPWRQKGTGRARAGRHMHVDELAGLLQKMRNEHIIITHTTQRTPMREIRRTLKDVLPAQLYEKIFIMDRRPRNRPATR